MKQEKRTAVYVLYFLLGLALFAAGLLGKVDEFWSGMGSGLVCVSILRFIRLYRFSRDENYREQVEVAVSDERNRFLRNKAWAWAGYLFILLMGISVIVLKIMGQELLSTAASFAVCLMLILYWGSYAVLKRKY